MFRHRRFSGRPPSRRNVDPPNQQYATAFDPPISARGLKGALYRAGPLLRPQFLRHELPDHQGLTTMPRLRTYCSVQRPKAKESIGLLRAFVEAARRNDKRQLKEKADGRYAGGFLLRLPARGMTVRFRRISRQRWPLMVNNGLMGNHPSSINPSLTFAA